MATLTSPVLQDLLTEVRILLNQQDPNNSFWRDNELALYLNEAVRIYFLECTLVNEGYFTTQTSLNITANVETVALPTDFFQIKNVWKKVTNGFLLLNYRNSVTESYSTQGGSDSQNYTPYYYFQGNNLVLRPTPNFSETAGLQIEYIQFPTTMVYGGDAITSQISPVFKQVIVMYAVYKAKLKESMVNGGEMHKIPEENLSGLIKLLKDSLSQRSKNPTYILPFNPETE